MDKRAFKQRMQNLKSYRENNPGKGYWDWKVEAFAEGGQTGDPEKERFYQATQVEVVVVDLQKKV